MIVICEGLIASELHLEGGKKYEIDHLGKGSIIKPYHYLVKRINKVRFRVKETSLIYAIGFETIALLAVDY